MEFEGESLNSAYLYGGVVSQWSLDLDPLSLVLVPHLDRIYLEKWVGVLPDAVKTRTAGSTRSSTAGGCTVALPLPWIPTPASFRTLRATSAPSIPSTTRCTTAIHRWCTHTAGRRCRH